MANDDSTVVLTDIKAALAAAENEAAQNQQHSLLLGVTSMEQSLISKTMKLPLVVTQTILFLSSSTESHAITLK